MRDPLLQGVLNLFYQHGPNFCQVTGFYSVLRGRYDRPIVEAGGL